jgi:hypothetical protein
MIVDPSKINTNGMQNMSETIVTKLYRFSGDMRDMSFLLKMARAENATLLAIAHENPSHVNDSSVADASATPPMTGMSDAYTGHAYTVPETRYVPGLGGVKLFKKGVRRRRRSKKERLGFFARGRRSKATK